MRCVNTKPPTMLIDANTTAKNPSHDEVCAPAAKIPPIIITLEIALVTDISGECKAGVTFNTT